MDDTRSVPVEEPLKESVQATDRGDGQIDLSQSKGFGSYFGSEDDHDWGTSYSFPEERRDISPAPLPEKLGLAVVCFSEVGLFFHCALG